MSSILKMMDGYKTYIAIIIGGILSILGHVDPESGKAIWEVPHWVWTVDGMFFFGAIRSAMDKMGMNKP